jgi:hypothetical protein
MPFDAKAGVHCVIWLRQIAQTFRMDAFPLGDSLYYERLELGLSLASSVTNVQHPNEEINDES